MSGLRLTADRRHAPWVAFLVHRVSGIALAAFLPLHFAVLGSVWRGEDALDDWLHWTESPVLQLAEVVLVLLLSAHLFGGVRLLLLEFGRMHHRSQGLLALLFGGSFGVALLFSLNLLAH